MPTAYSPSICRELDQRFRSCDLHRPMKIDRYDAGETLVYDLEPVSGGGAAEPVRATLTVERFVGGGFAGQVYRVKAQSLDPPGAGLLETGGTYALKILIPPSSFSRLFRNLLYAVGFQGPFQLQTNPEAARAGALWQKLIRRAAAVRLGDERAVNDVHATFVDRRLGSCGEISDWVEGRTWRLEVDERQDLLDRWLRGKPVDEAELGSPEFRAKKVFMARFVDLLRDMGAYEFARQYEWSTCKSQPNCLKRLDTEHDPAAGLMAVDFRAGLALLPFLPMSPGDVLLILRGIARGSLVQFDRGDIRKLERFVESGGGELGDAKELLPELKRTEEVYRNSVPDITHNHFRLLYSATLWRTMLSSAVTGWRTMGLVDEEGERRLRGNPATILLYALLGLIPFLGRPIRKAWGHGAWRRHYRSLVSSPGYLSRAIDGKIVEAVAAWHRAGRIEERNVHRVAGSRLRFAGHLVLSILPVGVHKFLTDGRYAKQRLHDLLVHPVRLYFDGALREEWLRDMVTDGRRRGIISAEDSEAILARIKEPFIQKYLKSLAVHVCTVPITQVVSVGIAIAYVLMHPEMPRAQAWAIGLGIVALFQVVPISPGSLTRGLYVVYLVIRERNIKDYNIALGLGFFKYVGYLAFPIQMTYRYPTLARFMAAHWATELVHVVPVFGESGALLEHWVFRMFYNRPLTIRRRVRRRAEVRSRLRPRYWHAAALAAAGGGLLGTADWLYYSREAVLPRLIDMAVPAALLPLLLGAAVTLGAGGATLTRRITAALLCGVGTGLAYAAVSTGIGYSLELGLAHMPVESVWRLFVFGVIAPIGAALTELALPEPKAKPAPAAADAGVE